MIDIFSRGWLSLVCILGCSSVSDDGRSWVATPAEPGTESDDPEAFEEQQAIGVLKQPIVGNHQVCSVLVPSNWRDSIVVPDNWTIANCRNLCLAFEATRLQLGCLSNSTVTFGSVTNCSNQLSLPPGNVCGWQ
jgi:hypothetical protein